VKWVDYEQVIVESYFKVIRKHLEIEESHSTIEKDEELLHYLEEKPNGGDFQYRMAVRYRLERKKILASQMHMIFLMTNTLRQAETKLIDYDNPASLEPIVTEPRFRDLVMELSAFEQEEKDMIMSISTEGVEEDKDKQGLDEEKEERQNLLLERWEEVFFKRRLINSDYYRLVK
jgi:hypothetical protein